METNIRFDIKPQPDDYSCGPTCLHAVYTYYQDTIPLSQVIRETRQLREGGTLAVLLACHALQRGYKATLYSYNMLVFDPTWFEPGRIDIKQKLRERLEYKEESKLRLAIKSYLKFIEMGGEIRFTDLRSSLIHQYMKYGKPILTGLSATYLYRTPREYGPKSEYDDVRGDPSGHFVVICGYNKDTRKALIADPLNPNPLSVDHVYPVDINRLIGAILMGVLTYDANLLILHPPSEGFHI